MEHLMALMAQEFQNIRTRLERVVQESPSKKERQRLYVSLLPMYDRLVASASDPRDRLTLLIMLEQYISRAECVSPAEREAVIFQPLFAIPVETLMQMIRAWSGNDKAPCLVEQVTEPSQRTD